MKRTILLLSALMLIASSNAQINLNKLQKAAQGVMKQNSSSNNKSNSNTNSSAKPATTWTCTECNTVATLANSAQSAAQSK